MTAEPIPATETRGPTGLIGAELDSAAAMWQPDPARQRRADHTLEDLLTLPHDAPRVELVDGVLHVAPSPTENHQDIVSLLWSWLRAHTPADYKVTAGMSVALTERDVRIPDVIVRRAGGSGARHFVTADQVVIAVEVVSPGTRRTDRFAKPGEYAAAGIRHYWRIEQDPVHVYAYRLSDRPGRSGYREYELVADSADSLKLTEPFEISIPISQITP
ncbi:Uma2 family endonuclease [Pilimelia columellifera]|uniref:Uma2 family endonuclease n=1 Tax=Pilimelia columellifera subsp. columellifera TaxID=706583 RepID=A0ABN3NCM3_9ACTN